MKFKSGAVLVQLTVKQLLNESKIDFTNTIIGPFDLAYVELKENCFEITPQQYLNFAKCDNQNSDIRGRINSVSNSKRSIDCLIEIIFHSLSINIESESLKIFSEYFFDSQQSVSYKLKIIKALNLAPVFMISNIRNLRNKIEHGYSIPTKEDVISAIELAEFFNTFIMNKFDDMFLFFITDQKNTQIDINKSELHFKFENNNIVIYYKDKKVTVENNDINYPVIIAMMLTALNDKEKFYEYLKYFLLINEHPIPVERIKILKNEI